MKAKCVNAIALLVLSSVALATPPGFQELYDHYFPNDEYQNGEYRRWFDTTLFGAPPNRGEDRHSVYYAFRGNAELSTRSRAIQTAMAKENLNSLGLRNVLSCFCDSETTAFSGSSLEKINKLAKPLAR